MAAITSHAWSSPPGKFTTVATLIPVPCSDALAYFVHFAEYFSSLETNSEVDRRIADVMSFEKTKSRVKGSRAYEMFRKGPGRLLDAIKAPGQGAPEDLPGRWQR